MSGIATGISAFVDDLKDAGLERVVVDLADVNPPCYWVALASVDYPTLGGEREATLHVLCVSSYPDETHAYEELDDLHDQLLGVVSPTEETTVVGLRVPSTQTTLPALRVTTVINL